MVVGTEERGETTGSGSIKRWREWSILWMTLKPMPRGRWSGVFYVSAANRLTLAATDTKKRSNWGLQWNWPSIGESSVGEGGRVWRQRGRKKNLKCTRRFLREGKSGPGLTKGGGNETQDRRRSRFFTGSKKRLSFKRKKKEGVD